MNQEGSGSEILVVGICGSLRSGSFTRMAVDIALRGAQDVGAKTQMIFGYYTALERTLFCDHVSDAHLDLWEKNVKVHERGLELIKPGARCCDIASELNEMYREWDLLKYRSFRYGHSFGVLCHYYGREAGVELREDIETELEPNMVVSMEPMIMIPEGQPGAGGYREHDILVITEDGSRNITGFPYGPGHNIIKHGHRSATQTKRG